MEVIGAVNYSAPDAVSSNRRRGVSSGQLEKREFAETFSRTKFQPLVKRYHRRDAPDEKDARQMPRSLMCRLSKRATTYTYTTVE